MRNDIDILFTGPDGKAVFERKGTAAAGFIQIVPRVDEIVTFFDGPLCETPMYKVRTVLHIYYKQGNVLIMVSLERYDA